MGQDYNLGCCGRPANSKRCAKNYVSEGNNRERFHGKWNVGISLSVFAVSSGVKFYKWCKGGKTYKEFSRLTLTQAGGAVGSNTLGILGTNLGLGIRIFFGPIRAVIGATIGGLAGAIGGHLVGEKLMDWISVNWFGLKEDED